MLPKGTLHVTNYLDHSKVPFVLQCQHNWGSNYLLWSGKRFLFWLLHTENVVVANFVCCERGVSPFLFLLIYLKERDAERGDVSTGRFAAYSKLAPS